MRKNDQMDDHPFKKKGTSKKSTSFYVSSNNLEKIEKIKKKHKMSMAEIFEFGDFIFEDTHLFKELSNKNIEKDIKKSFLLDQKFYEKAKEVAKNNDISLSNLLNMTLDAIINFYCEVERRENIKRKEKIRKINDELNKLEEVKKYCKKIYGSIDTEFLESLKGEYFVDPMVLPDPQMIEVAMIVPLKNVIRELENEIDEACEF